MRFLPRNRWLRRLGILVYTVVILVVLAVGGLAARLAFGPINLDFATARIERALTPSDGSYNVGIDNAYLAWEGWDRGLNLQAIGVSLRRTDGSEFAAVPSLSFTVNLWRLTNGELAPNSITIRRPRLTMRRAPDGQITLGLEQATPQNDRFVPSILGAFSRQEPTEGPMRFLTEIRIDNGSLTINDAAMGRRWETSDLNARLWREAEGIRGDLGFVLNIGGREIDLRATVRHGWQQAATQARLVFTGLDPEVFEAAEGPLRAFGWFRMPLDGAALLVVNDERRITGFGLEVTGGEGRIDIPEAYQRPLDVRSVSATARISEDGSRLELGPMRIDFGGPVLTLTGTASQGETESRFAGRAVFNDLPVDEIGTYWPRNLAWKGRAWVAENISAGTVPELSVDVRLRIGSGAGAPITVDSVNGRFAFEDISVRYIDYLPPVTDVSGSSSFDMTGMTFVATSGRLDDVHVSRADATITDLDKDPARMALRVRTTGPLSTILRVIDRPPLGYSTEIGANPSQVEGQAAATLTARFPLLRTLELNTVQLDVRATLTEVAWRRGLFGRDITEGRFDLRLDRAGMNVSGPARLGGAPITLDWRENFDETEAVRRTLQLDGQLTPELLTDSGVALPGLFEGRAGMRLVATGRRDGTNQLDARFDIDDARLRLPFLGAEKPRGETGTAHLSILLQGERPVRISRFDVDSESLHVRSSMTFFDDGMTLRELTVDRLRAGRTDVSGVVESTRAGDRTIRLEGESLDLVPLFAAGEEEGDDEQSEQRPTRVELRANVEHAYFGDGPPMQSVRASFVHDGVFFRSISLTGRPDGAAPVSINLAPQGEGQVFRVSAQDAGALLRSLGVADNVREGVLTIEASRPRVEEGVPFTGRAEAGEYHLVDAPNLARLIVFRGQNNEEIDAHRVDFDRFIAPFRFNDGVLDIRNGRANGSKVGLTFAGRIDLNTERLDLQGTAVPAYRLNSLLGRIPGLGRVFVGEEGSGVLAARWRAEGALEEPNVQVNEMSVLTPGFTRYIFDIFQGENDEAPDFDQPQRYYDLGP